MKNQLQIVALILVSLFGKSLFAIDKFDSAHSIAVVGTIKEGILHTKSDSDYIIRSEIKEQLYYTIGQLNGDTGVADMNRLEFKVIHKEALPDSEFVKVRYSATLFIAWPRNREIPKSYQLVLPGQGSYQGRSEFFKTFGNHSARCMDPSAHDVTVGIFWYYYRPLMGSCSLNNNANHNRPLIESFPMELKVSQENTEGKYPEYGKVWEDGKLVITSIFGMAEADATTDWDAGISSFKELYGDLIYRFGKPIESNIGLNQKPGINLREVLMTFSTPAGEVDVAIYLVKDIKYVDSVFMAKYNERTKISDFISYSGHSGLGANIRALARMGEFQTGQYQVFLVNGCDTFAYVDQSLSEAHQRVNPGAGANKHIDLITNAMPSYFHYNSRSNMQVIEGLVGQSKTYREILAGFSSSQKAVVTGEEDNNWPAPF